MLFFIFAILFTGSLGNNEVYFYDDFDYDVGGQYGNTVFGVNNWKFGGGVGVGKAWYAAGLRSWEEIDVGYIQKVPFGIRLGVDSGACVHSGYDENGFDCSVGAEGRYRWPTMRTALSFGDGTHVARVRFSVVPPPYEPGSNRTMIAGGGYTSTFWLQTHGVAQEVGGEGYGSEVDYEWYSGRDDDNNYPSSGIGYEFLKLANIRSGSNYTSNFHANCNAWDGYEKYYLEGCRPGFYNGSQGTNKWLSIVDRWITLVLVVEKAKATWFYLESDGDVSFRGANSLSEYTGIYDFARVSYAENAHPPVHDMAPHFGVLPLPPEGESVDTYHPPEEDMYIDIDYYYYTSDKMINSDGIVDMVGISDKRQQFAALSGGLGRATSLPSLDPGFIIDDPVDPSFSTFPKGGLVAGVDSRRQIVYDPVRKGSRSYFRDMGYRFVYCDGSWGSMQRNVGDSAFIYFVPNNVQSVRAVIWYGEDENDMQKYIETIPVSGTCGVSKSQKIGRLGVGEVYEVKVYDLVGRLVWSGSEVWDVSGLDHLPSGIYLVVEQGRAGRVVRKVVKR